MVRDAMPKSGIQKPGNITFMRTVSRDDNLRFIY